MKHLFILLTALILSGCAVTSQYVQRPVEQPTDRASSPADSATIYVIRPSIVGSAVKAGIYQGGTRIGKLGPKNFLHWSVPAGQEIEIISKTENRARVKLTPEAGKTYYYKQGFGFGWLIARSKLKVMTEADANRKLLRLQGPGVVVVEPFTEVPNKN
jgi:hypothetical protein